MRVAVMQPYFLPHGGYWRLLACVDRFVILQGVQHPRRGRVHRCELTGPGGRLEWLTLPLARQPRATTIAGLRFAADAAATFDRRLARHPWIGVSSSRGPAPDGAPGAAALRGALRIPSQTTTACGVAPYLAAQIRLVAGLLGFAPEILSDAALRVPAGLRGQDRIVALARAAAGESGREGAAVYVNLPGGRALYDPAAFRAAGLGLAFLPPWQGPGTSLLPELLAALARDEGPALGARIAAQARPAIV